MNNLFKCFDNEVFKAVNLGRYYQGITDLLMLFPTVGFLGLS
ncbi:MAG: hypothetical protein QXR55_00785 [Sulfolobales archaeon]